MLSVFEISTFKWLMATTHSQYGGEIFCSDYWARLSSANLLCLIFAASPKSATTVRSFPSFSFWIRQFCVRRRGEGGEDEGGREGGKSGQACQQHYKSHVCSYIQSKDTETHCLWSYQNPTHQWLPMTSINTLVHTAHRGAIIIPHTPNICSKQKKTGQSSHIPI